MTNLPAARRPRRWLAGCLGLGLLAAAAAGRADGVAVPPDGTGIRFDPPAGWSCYPEGTRAVCQTPSGHTLYEFTATREAVTPAELREQAHEWSDDAGLTITEEREERPQANAHGVVVQGYRIEGTDAHGALRQVGMALLTPPGGPACLLRTAFDLSERGKYLDGMTALTASIRPGGTPLSSKGEALRFPADGSGLALVVPTGWSAAPEGADLRVRTADGALSILIRPAGGPADPSGQLPDLARALAGREGITGGKLREDRTKSSADLGVAVYSCSVEGTRHGEDAVAGISLVTLPDGHRWFVQGAFDLAAAKPHQDEIEAFFQSVKAAR